MGFPAPHLILAIAAVAALAFGLALLVDQRLPDLYLTTSPGGINTAFSTTEGLRATMPLLARVQSLRLVLMILAVPVLQCMIAIPAKSVPERRGRACRNDRAERAGTTGPGVPE
ncbi:AbrB family transcriptional regulator [Nocardia terpenica]|uniref:AbrB family transcriptional regulator n=1 Tax=Nocardia terpenica TaxID=455432 RepID=UPI0002D3E0B7|nr:AbrB family transcriptional regulator [Nocardia terpenica]NQE90229.1 hypothetical protein [Nocardia terpenica]